MSIQDGPRQHFVGVVPVEEELPPLEQYWGEWPPQGPEIYDDGQKPPFLAPQPEHRRFFGRLRRQGR